MFSHKPELSHYKNKYVDFIVFMGKLSHKPEGFPAKLLILFMLFDLIFLLFKTMNASEHLLVHLQRPHCMEMDSERFMNKDDALQEGGAGC